MDIIAGKLNETGTKTIELGGDYRAYVTILGTGDGGFEAFTSTYKGREMIGEVKPKKYEIVKLTPRAERRQITLEP